MDENGGLTPEGETGELYVAGYNLALGYVGLLDNERFIKNPYSKTIGRYSYIQTKYLFRCQCPYICMYYPADI